MGVDSRLRRRGGRLPRTGLGVILGAALSAAMWLPGACARSDTDVCSNGLRCPLGQVCAARQDVCIDILGCGDLYQSMDEECDDGNVIPGDGCSASCTVEECGNQIIDVEEACEREVPFGFYCADLGYDFGHLACLDCQIDDRLCGGFEWLRMGTSSAVDLRAVWAGASDSVFVVGDQQTLLTYDGESWSQRDIRVQLNALSGLGPAFALGVGERGAVMRYDGTAWMGAAQTATTADLHAVFVDAPEHALAAGDMGTIVEYANGAWSLIDHQVTDAPLYGIWVAKSGAVFAVGAAGTVLHGDDTGWQIADPGLPDGENTGENTDLYAVWGRSDREVYAVGQSGSVVRYDGQTWTALALVTPEHWRGLFGDMAENPAEARLFMVGDRGVIGEYAAGRLSLSNSTIEQALFGITSVSVEQTDGQMGGPMTEQMADQMTGSQVFAVGANGVILHRRGNLWSQDEVDTQLEGPPRPVHGLWGRSPDDIYAVGGNGLFLHYDGTRWSDMATAATAGRWWYDVWGSPPGALPWRVYAVGDQGGLARCEGPNSCVVAQVVSARWRAIWGRDTGLGYELFVVGQDTGGDTGGGATAMRCNELECMAIALGSGGFGDLYDVHGHVDEVYAVGERGIFQLAPALHIWADAEAERPVRAIRRHDDDRYLIAGERGLLGEFDGATVTLTQAPSSQTLTTIAGQSVGDMYIAGPERTLLHCDGLDCAPVRVPEPAIDIAAMWVDADVPADRQVALSGPGGEIFRLRLPEPEGNTE